MTVSQNFLSPGETECKHHGEIDRIGRAQGDHAFANRGHRRERHKRVVQAQGFGGRHGPNPRIVVIQCGSHRCEQFSIAVAERMNAAGVAAIEKPMSALHIPQVGPLSLADHELHTRRALQFRQETPGTRGVPVEHFGGAGYAGQCGFHAFQLRHASGPRSRT